MACESTRGEELDRFLERWAPGVSRRRFLRDSGLGLAWLAGGGALLAGVQGFARTAAAQPAPAARSLKGTGEVIYGGYGGIYEQGLKTAVFEPFTRDTGITVQTSADGGNTAKVAAAVKAGRPQWDVIENPLVTRGANVAMGIFQSWDPGIVDTSGIVDKRFIDPHGPSFYSYAVAIYWNTKAVSAPLQSWADVWNVDRFPGKRGFQNISVRTLPEAVMADGVPVDKVFPLDVDRAFRALDRIRPHAVFQPLNALSNLASRGEIVAGDLNLARTKALMAAQTPLAYTWNQAIVDLNALGVVAGAANRENANKLIAYTLLPQTQLRVLDALGYTPTAKAALDTLTPDRLKDLAGTEVTMRTSVLLDGKYYAEHYAANEKRFQEWLLAAK